jgi:hypothetical protein
MKGEREKRLEVLLMRAEILISSHDYEALRLWWDDVADELYGSGK